MKTVLLFKLLMVLSPLVFLLPLRWKMQWGILLQLLLAVVTTTWALSAWSAVQPLVIDLGIPFWGGTPNLVIDRLSAFFMLLINLVSLTGALYGIGYLKPYQTSKGPVAFSIHTWAFYLLHASMLHVVMLREGFAFLMAWEVMSMSSFLLVIFNAEEDGNLTTGIKYLIQMHAGFTFLLLGFLWVSQQTGFFGFDGLAPYFAGHTNWILFLVLFTGFGIKAGIMPLHTWLPHAHPAAPSSVSGVMSGIMIKMGLYGILRVLMDVQSDFAVLGFTILFLSMLTAIGGILSASLQRDIKKLLAYSSIENVGIIGIGIGVAVLGRHFDSPVLSSLALTGALVHILNHAVYKSMLFFTAGNVYYATHSRDMNKLGGLMKAMPVSGGLFLLGALSICAIPPFNGFVSEFLIYSSILQQISAAGFTFSMISLVVILSLVIVGGLTVYSFTKAFGMTFQGSSRRPLHAVEVPWLMRIPGYISALFILIIALGSPRIVSLAGEITSLYANIHVQPSLLTEPTRMFTNISLVSALILGVTALVLLIRKLLQHREPTQGPTWGCGYSGGDARHQYTSTSYGQYVKELAGPAAGTRESFTPIEEAEIFPAAREFRTETRDLIEEEVMIKPVEKGLRQMAGIGWAQTGKISHYLVYPLFFLLIIVLLTRFGLI